MARTKHPSKRPRKGSTTFAPPPPPEAFGNSRPPSSDDETKAGGFSLHELFAQAARRRGPIRRSTALCVTTDENDRARWLWVPACAGTTAEYVAPLAALSLRQKLLRDMPPDILRLARQQLQVDEGAAKRRQRLVVELAVGREHRHQLVVSRARDLLRQLQHCRGDLHGLSLVRAHERDGVEPGGIEAAHRIGLGRDQLVCRVDDVRVEVAHQVAEA